MGGNLLEIHGAISRCRRCAGILDQRRIIPRSGFPPAGNYQAMVIGCEPGQAAERRISPEEYRKRFDWRTPNNRNTVRLLFKAIHDAGVDWDRLFYTNTVKCPATPDLASTCYSYCRGFLQAQIEALDPRIIVAFGRAAERIGVPRAAKGQIIDCTFEDRSCIVLTHPQGATSAYLAEAGRHVFNKMCGNPNEAEGT